MIACKKTRLTAAGNISAKPAMLHWILVENQDNDTRYVILNDATSGTGEEVIKLGVPSKQTKPFYFDPPIPFNTGIRVGTFEESAMVVLGGYTD